MSTIFVTEISNQHASAGAEVTNMNGNIFHTNIYVIDSEHINYIASLFAETRALERIDTRTRSDRGPRAHVPEMEAPAAAPAGSTSRTNGVKETRRTKLLRRLGAWRAASVYSDKDCRAALRQDTVTVVCFYLTVNGATNEQYALLHEVEAFQTVVVHEAGEAVNPTFC
ncbi:hypothetical protein FIBSPDRAFT_897506 [Athelia psychrophila]|uniref:Uncharacterized protein n=1 Tax=Athelia psychrophila TaxID=1759441 RepID=A0A166C7P5_9AGAM|nr:hypothetical protein FIBSPDRAFT_897506 [Fibularhizoctonia sp. CBS 109695]